MSTKDKPTLKDGQCSPFTTLTSQQAHERAGTHKGQEGRKHLKAGGEQERSETVKQLHGLGIDELLLTNDT